MKLDSLAKEWLPGNYDKMVAWRRHMHQYPEISFQEKRTAAWISDRLKELGCSVSEGIGGNGLVVSIKGELPGPVVALRADMDALPIQDEKNCAYASRVPGVMHACGHDGHTAALLAIAEFYEEHKSSLQGERRLLFQPAEEVTPGGAIQMIRDGVLEGVDVIYGVHLWTPLAYGSSFSRAGALMSAADEFVLEIVGRGGHGGMPHQTTDTVMIGSALVQAAQTIVSRNVSPTQPVVVTFGSFQAGTTTNVIAEKCILKGTVRSFEEETRQLARQRLEDIIRHTCEMHGAAYQYDMRIGYPPVVNDEAEAGRYFEVAGAVFGEGNVAETEPLTVAEDFSYYLLQKPGCFMFVGAGNPECEAVYSHHHPKFDFDERAMLKAAELMIAMAENYAAEHAD
ncbi:amidohydrolase [Paenibacillus sp. CAU 1782]